MGFKEDRCTTDHHNQIINVIMASSSRNIIRLLSPRLYPRTKTSLCLRYQIRTVSGRYSDPTKRAASTAPTAASSFLGMGNTAAPEPYSPVDARSSQQQQIEKRQYHLRRMRFAGMGLLLSLMGTAMIIYNIDLDELEEAEKKRKGLQLDASDEANAKFQGKEVQVIGAGSAKRIVAHGQGGDIELVETGTSSAPHFPRTIYLPSSAGSAAPPSTVAVTAQPNAPENPGNIANQEEYTLIGLGIRTVMWIQVYVVGMYIRTTDISALQSRLIHTVNPSASTLMTTEQTELRKQLLDPESSRQIWSELLEIPGIKTAWRIVPTRNTDFGHLRDGFVNGINARTAEARSLLKGVESEFDSEDFGEAVQSLKAIFTGGNAPKQSTLILLRGQTGALNVLFQAKPGEDGKDKLTETLGSVTDQRISKLIWLGYLAGAKVSSNAAREGVVDGCVKFAARPVGSVETRVL